MIEQKIFYSLREIPWMEPDDFFNLSRIKDGGYEKISFFINNSPDSCGGEERQWCYVSCQGTKPLVTIRLASGVGARDVARIFEGALAAIVPPDEKPSPFSGGLIGYLNYEALGFFEKIKLREKEKSPVRESVFFVPSAFMAFNKISKRAFLYRASLKKNDTTIEKSADDTICLSQKAPEQRGYIFQEKIQATSNFTKKNFKQAVCKVKNYIAAGDIFQANIARRWRINLPEAKLRECDGKEIFLTLKKINPSPYSCYIKYKDTEIISSSPELLVARRGDVIETRPIAGTRPRGENLKDDRRLSVSLILSPKERAEHIMLVDLERNDLGKISRSGSVKVAKPMVIEKYSHVQHIVSHIRGKSKKTVKPFDILRAMFPGGTITGCPKIRSIQIIDEIEPVERGPYCGSAGWIQGGSSRADMEFNILIRTIIKTPQAIDFYAGAGIVADSDPEREFEETRHKARALAEALRVKI